MIVSRNPTPPEKIISVTDKPDTVAASNGLKVNLEVLCDKLATARVALADAEANMKLLRDLFVNENSGEPN